MESNSIESQYKNDKQQMPAQLVNRAREIGSRAAAVAGEQVGKLAEQTEKSVRKYPMAAVGIALGSGVVLGTLGALLFTPRPPTMQERLADMQLGSYFKKLLSRYF